MENNDDWMKEFHKVFTKINERFESASEIITENVPLKFNSIEEARRYFKSIPFSEWLNKAREKYDI